MEATTQPVDPIPPRHGNDNLFDDGVVFISFLKALIEHCSNDPSQMNNPNEIQALTDNAEICEYKDLILNQNFAVRWKTLYAKCSMDDQPHLKTMLEKALIINDAIATRGDLLTCFNDFAAPPRKEKDDMQRYLNELNTLKNRHVDAYNEAQKYFVKNCQVTAQNSMIMFYWQALLRNGFCDAKCFELQYQNVFEALQGLNLDGDLVPPNDVSSYVFLTNLGPCKCWQQVTSTQTQTVETDLQSSVSLLLPEPNRDVEDGIVRLESDPGADKQTQHESELTETPQCAPGVKRNADVASGPSPQPVCKRPRPVPKQYISPQFENFAEFQEFLKVLVRECSHELSQFETTDDLKKLVDHPAMLPFKGILSHEDFVLRWDELHDKCGFFLKANRRMDADVEEIQALLKKPRSLHWFADFPVKPNGNIEDTTRYIAQLRTAMHTDKFAHLNKMQMRHVKICLRWAKKKRQDLKRLNCTV